MFSRTITPIASPSEKVNASTGKQYIYDWVLPTAGTRIITWGNLNTTEDICTADYYLPILMASQYPCATGAYTDSSLFFSVTSTSLGKRAQET